MMMMMMRIGESMRLDLESGVSKCISDEIKLNSMTVGTYHIVNPNEAIHLPPSHKLFVTVSFQLYKLRIVMVIYDSFDAYHIFMYIR